MLVLLLIVLIQCLICLACLIFAIWQARLFFTREDKWRARDQELRDQLWVMAGGKRPVVKYEHEKIVKVPDPDAPTLTMTAWDEALLNDEVKEELERMHPDVTGMSVAQVQAKYGHEWKQAEQWLREARKPMRAS